MKVGQNKGVQTYITDDITRCFGCQNRNGIFGKEVTLVDGVNKTFTIIFLGENIKIAVRFQYISCATKFFTLPYEFNTIHSLYNSYR